MRKWFYAGAVVGGVLLLGAAPAQADVVPIQTDGLLQATNGRGVGLDPAGGLNLESPLGGASQLLSFRPGQNAADLQTSGSSLSDMLPQDGLLPKDGLMPDEGRRVARSQGAGLVPAGWSVAGSGASVGGAAGRRVAGKAGQVGRAGGGLPGGNLTSIIPTGLLGGSLLGGGLLGGGLPTAGSHSESALFDGGLPLLGGLGGLMPVNVTPEPDTDADKDKDKAGDNADTGADTGAGTGTDTGADRDADDVVTTMPVGGTVVDPATVDPAIDEPVRDPRLHEEPIDDEAGGDKRAFTGGGRPIAGEDEDFK